jgi:hypothetical protein
MHFKQNINKVKMGFGFFIRSLVCWFYIYYLFFLQFDRSVGQTKQTLFTMGLVLLVYVPKMVLTLVLLGEDIFRMGLGQ